MALPNEIIFVSGQRGSGKSYWTKQYIRSLPRCIIFDSLGEYDCDQRFNDPEQFIDFLIDDQRDPRLFTACYDTHLSDEQFPIFCRAILARGDVYVIIEELDLYSKPFATEPEFAKLIKYGRHYGIQLVGVSRRPAEVSRNFTANTTKFIIFQNREPNDIKYFKSIVGQEAENIANLPPHHFYEIDFSIHPAQFNLKNPI